MSNENQLVKHDEGSVTFKGHDQLKGETISQSDGTEEFKRGRQFYGERNYPEAIKWLTLAADLGHMNAMHWLGNIYKLGRGVEKSFKMALNYFSKAIDDKSLSTDYYLGRLYHTWDGPEKDLSQALYHYTQSADRGHGEAMHQLGGMYYRGEGVKQNYAKAVYYLEKAVPVIETPIIILPFMYKNGGYGIEQDNEKALHYAYIALTKAAQSTSEYEPAETEKSIGVLLMMMIVDLHKTGNYEAAFSLGNKVLAFKSPASRCLILIRLGEIYYERLKSFEQASHYFEIGSNIATCGESPNTMADSQAWLGRMYFIGRGIQKDTQKAFELLDTAYKLESQVACTTLCAIFGNGYEVGRDLKKAIQYCEQVKQTEITDNILGHLYYFTAQYDKALPRLKTDWDKKNDPYTANTISHMYINGVGVEKDFATARKWAKNAGEFEKSLIELIEMDHANIRTQLLETAPETMKKAPDEFPIIAGNYGTKLADWHFSGFMGLTLEEEQSLFGWS